MNHPRHAQPVTLTAPTAGDCGLVLRGALRATAARNQRAAAGPALATVRHKSAGDVASCPRLTAGLARDIYIGADSRLDGGILVHKRNVIGLSLGDDLKLGIPVGRSTPPRVVIGPRATVAGVLRFKREVKLLVSESATIGPVVGATPVMFATEQLPQ